MFLRCLYLFFFLLLTCSDLGAEPVDSVLAKRDLGLAYMLQQRYVKAYKCLKFYLKYAPDEEKVKKEYNQVAKIYRETQEKIREQSERCFKDAETAVKKGQKATADSLYQAYLQLCVLEGSQETFSYTVALSHYAMWLQRKGQTDESLKILNKVLQIRQTSQYIDRVHSGETLNLIASVQNQQGNYNEAIETCTRAANLYKERYGKENSYYGTTLGNLANYYISRNEPGDLQHALELGEMAVKILPQNDPAYAQAVNNLAVYYTMADDVARAQKYSKNLQKSTKKIEKNTVHYASILSNQAISLANAGNYPQAISYAKEAIAIFQEKGDTASLNFARLLSNTASFEKHLEHYKDAISLWERAVPIFEQIEGTGGTGYLSCMSEISAAHSRIGNLEIATNINEQLQNTVSEQVLKADRHFAFSLSRRASILAADGNYQQAIALQQQALSIFSNRQDVADEANVLNELSSYLYHTGQLQQAIDTCKHALRLYEGIAGHAVDHALALNSLSIYYFSDTRYDEALATSKEAIRLYEQSGETENSFFAKILTNQALYEAKRDSVQTAIDLSLRADSIQRKMLGDIHPDNVMLRFNLANYYIRLNKIDEAQHYFHDALTTQMQHVRSNFSHLSTRGRELYWGTKSYIFRSAPYMACLMEDNDSTLVDAYNAQLFTKGLLLNSEINFRNLLARTASPKLQEKYEELSRIHKEIESIWRNPSEEARAQISELTATSVRLERELMKGCKEFGDFTESMSISYTQVAEALGEHDAAIEFFDIETANGDRIYWALLARHGWAAPKLIRLFSANELDSFRFTGKPLTEALTSRDGIHAVFEHEDVGQCVWGNIIPHLSGVKNIWFAPSGLFYQWGIEYLRYTDRRINDIFSIHRVSSTKSLAQASQFNSSITQAAIFGGLDYDASATELQAANMQLSEMNYDFVAEYIDSLSLDSVDWAMAEIRTLESFVREGRGSVGYLVGTEVEASLIGECLMMQNIESEMYVGTLGTEEAFKRLSGRRIPLIHIATHGFSLSEAAVNQHRESHSYLNISNEEVMQADNSLCYSGLLMAGANNVLNGKSLPKDLENGVLTAREIASLDLRGLDLAVLSACQTGLGELKEDGVFGLQRGFKKAGAHTLLMSLWSVDDEATQIMMTQFYKSLVAGDSRRQAFRKAQQALRDDARFSSPFFWASFVMLDD